MVYVCFWWGQKKSKQKKAFKGGNTKQMIMGIKDKSTEKKEWKRDRY